MAKGRFVAVEGGVEWVRCARCTLAVVATRAAATKHVNERCVPEVTRELLDEWRYKHWLKQGVTVYECSACGRATQSLKAAASGRCPECMKAALLEASLRKAGEQRRLDGVLPSKTNSVATGRDACPKCGARSAGPGALCPRCSVEASRKVERIGKWEVTRG